MSLLIAILIQRMKDKKSKQSKDGKDARILIAVSSQAEGTWEVANETELDTACPFSHLF